MNHLQHLQQLPLWLDVLLSVLVILGCFFAFVGSWGLLRLSTFLRRIHGPTKATTLGVGCILVASALWFTLSPTSIGWSWHEFLITIFLFVTAPVSAQLLIKSALKHGDGITKAERPPSPPAS
jgi:multicomponent K+:H+ antiporter subunit G